MKTSLPAKCFISHSYADSAARDRLIGTLPHSVSPVVFPPINARPHEFVSKHLIDALLRCDGLIYLRGGASDKSFWVAFERDYVLRTGRAVFSYDIGTGEIAPDTARPLDLAVYASYHRGDKEKVRSICKFLGEERSFDVWLDITSIRPGTLFEDEIKEGLADRLNRGGYMMVFWSHSASRAEWIEDELKTAASQIDRLNDRVLFALLEPCSLPTFWMRFNEPSVQLFGDRARPETHRVDDLMVRLYWLIYRKTRSAET
jgi:hypothetical protein